eukprot:s2612_g8.t1
MGESEAVARPPDRRRCAIQALPQKVRLALEGWILQQRRPAVAKQAVGGHIWQRNCHGSGFVAAIHLGRGLHAQSAACKARSTICSAMPRFAAQVACQMQPTLGQRYQLPAQLQQQRSVSPASDMHIHRRTCSQVIAPAVVAKRFAQSVLEAQPRTMKLYIRARMRVTSDKRLSSPLRTDAGTAVLDWLQLGIHEGDSLNPVGKERPSSDKAAKRWLHASEAWMRIWKQRGRDADALQKELNAMQAQFRGALLQSLKRQQCAFTEMQQLAEEPRELGSALYGVGTLGWCRKASNEAVAASLHLDTCCSWLYIANAISCADLVRQFPFGSYSVELEEAEDALEAHDEATPADDLDLQLAELRDEVANPEMAAARKVAASKAAVRPPPSRDAPDVSEFETPAHAAARSWVRSRQQQQHWQKTHRPMEPSFPPGTKGGKGKNGKGKKGKGWGRRSIGGILSLDEAASLHGTTGLQDAKHPFALSAFGHRLVPTCGYDCHAGMAEDPLECSLLTLDLGNEDVCISTGSSGLFAEVADPMPKKCRAAETAPGMGKRSPKQGKPNPPGGDPGEKRTSFETEFPSCQEGHESASDPFLRPLLRLSEVSQVIELPLPEPTIASVSTHDDLVAECVTPISLDEGRRREPAISLAVPATEVVAPGSIPSPSNSDTVQKVCGIGGIGIAAASASRHEQCPSEATPTVGIPTLAVMTPPPNAEDFSDI